MKLTTSSFILGLCTLPPPLAGLLALAKSFRLKEIKQDSALKGYVYRGQKILVLFFFFFCSIESLEKLDHRVL